MQASKARAPATPPTIGKAEEDEEEGGEEGAEDGAEVAVQVYEYAGSVIAPPSWPLLRAEPWI